MIITREKLLAYAPTARPEYLQAFLDLAPEIEAASINSPLAVAHFIGQIGHETGSRHGYMTIARENTSWDGATMKRLWPDRFPLGAADPRIVMCKGDARKLGNLAYSNRHELGNQGGDDGWLYRGGGGLQITGRECFQLAGMAIGLDLENYPDEIEQPEVWLRVALWYWTTKTGYNLSQFAVWNYGRAVGNAINRGTPFSKHEPIGYKQRQLSFQKAWSIFGNGEMLPEPNEMHLGAHGPAVERAQVQLQNLGYAVGAIDGVYGPGLDRALAAFKHENQHMMLEAVGIGPHIIAALEVAEPVRLSPERVNATKKDLKASGSTEVAAGDTAQKVGGALVAAGTTAGTVNLGLLDSAMVPLKQVTVLKSTLVPFMQALAWCLQHIWWVMLIVGGIWLWRSGRLTVLARLAAHQLGWNLRI